MKLLLRRYFVLVALVFINAVCFAGEPPPPPKGPGPPGFPIDSGIYILLLFAVALGLYKVFQFKNIKKTPN